MTEKCILSFHSRKLEVWKKLEKRMKGFNICGAQLAVAAVDGRSQLIRNRASQYFEVSLLAQSVVGGMSQLVLNAISRSATTN